jgi:hypothetical protein
MMNPDLTSNTMIEEGVQRPKKAATYTKEI